MNSDIQGALEDILRDCIKDAGDNTRRYHSGGLEHSEFFQENINIRIATLNRVDRLIKQEILDGSQGTNKH